MAKIKSLFKVRFPNFYDFLRHFIGHKSHHLCVSELVISRVGLNVIGGPFSGMKYIQESVGSAFLPKILGCYEEEVHPFIDEIIKNNYPTIIDVGCAEGYYAIGLALRCSNAKVFAFDEDPKAQLLCQDLANKNGVEARVFVRGRCSSNDLKLLPLEGSLIVCDVEGYEVDLLDTEEVKGLAKADLLIELHEPMRAGSSEAVLARFAKTHNINIVDSIKRDPKSIGHIQFLSPKDQRIAVDEGRLRGQQFVYLSAFR